MSIWKIKNKQNITYTKQSVAKKLFKSSKIVSTAVQMVKLNGILTLGENQLQYN